MECLAICRRVNGTSDSASPTLSEIQKQFLLELCVLVRESVGLPDADYEVSKPHALELHRLLSAPTCTVSVDEAMCSMKANPKGAHSLLCVIIWEAHRHGWFLSLPDIGQSKTQSMPLGRAVFARAATDFLLRRAIEEYPDTKFD
jgi:hypothetical protein